MTNDEINEAIATGVHGWVNGFGRGHVYRKDVRLWRDSGGTFMFVCRNYSPTTNIAQAMEALEVFRATNNSDIGIQIGSKMVEVRLLEFFDIVGFGDDDESLPMAICKALLRWKGQEDAICL